MSGYNCDKCGKPMQPIFHGTAVSGWYCPDCKKGVEYKT